METTHESALVSKMLDRMLAGIYVLRISADGTQLQMQYANQACAAIFGTDHSCWQGDASRAFENVHPDDIELWTQRGIESMTQGVPFRWTGRVKQGEQLRYVRVVADPERQADGTVIWFGTALDVTEEELSRQQIQALLAEQARQQSLFRAVIDNLPVGVTVIDPDGTFSVFNRVSKQLSGVEDEQATVKGTPEELASSFGIFLPDGETRFPVNELPHVRALQGETVDTEMLLRSARRPEGLLVSIQALPLRLTDGSLVALNLSRDITAQRAMEDELRERNRQLASSEEEKSQLVERLRFAIDELSNPILEVWDDVLAMPLIGVVDSRRTADMAQRLLAEVARTQAQCVIIDLTGVEVVDTKTADNLIKLVRKIELIGARCLLTGIRPSVSETVVEIGVDFAGLATLRNLKHGLQEALRRQRRERVRFDEDIEDRDDDRPRSRRRRDD